MAIHAVSFSYSANLVRDVSGVVLGRVEEGTSERTNVRVLCEEATAHGQIRGRGALAPARIPIEPRPVVHVAEDEGGGLVLGRLGEDGDGQRRDAGRVQDDGHVVQVLEHAHTKRVDEAVRGQHSGVDADRLGRRRLVVAVLDRRGRRDEVRQAERDARGHGHLAQQVEPARDPGREGRPAQRRHHGRPEVRAAARRDGRDDLAHGDGDGEREE